jgi:alkanesulfonate monooxygenase SsuD/methylene tetrahydromethanopterin reductase-like flavin-dependent oxidoreductase (luciferase family)
MSLRFGLFLPPFAEFADPTRVVALAQMAEDTGWDGVFLWDHLLAAPDMAVADSWVTLAAIAQATQRLRLGLLVTPLARRRPWVVARQAATLDLLSAGRLVVGVGLGDDGWGEFSSFSGEPVEAADRALLLDESLSLLRRFWSGEPVRWQGKRLSVDSGAFLPRPVQDPLPVWVACRWPHRRPLVRAARHQGCFPLFDQGGSDLRPFPDPSDVATVRAELLAHGADQDVDIVCRGATDLVDPRERADGIAALADAGLTWWLESFGPGEPPAEVVERTVRLGPPARR